jgi:hypothetical protein
MPAVHISQPPFTSCLTLALCCTLLDSAALQINKKVEEAIKEADQTCKESDTAHCAAA